MNIEAVYGLLARVLFVGALALFALACAEFVLNLFSYTILSGAYTTGRLLEISVILLAFVISLLLRQIRDALRTKG